MRAAEAQQPFRQVGPIPYFKLDSIRPQLIAALEDEFARIARTRRIAAKDGRAILVHVCDKRNAHQRASLAATSCKELARTAGVEVADVVLQVRDQVDPKFVLGRGKLDEVVLRAMQLDVEVLIFDRNLTPAQATAIAKVTDLKVLDRTQLILDIFAQRAESARRQAPGGARAAEVHAAAPRPEGRLALAPHRRHRRARPRRDQARDRPPPREGARHAPRDAAQAARAPARAAPRASAPATTCRSSPSSATPTPARARCSTRSPASSVLAEDKLFATLDTRSRRLQLPARARGRHHRHRGLHPRSAEGSLRRVPRHVRGGPDADLLLHVVDAADPNIAEHIATTEKLLEELELDQVPRLVVYNKADCLPPDEANAKAREHDGVAVSALDKNTLRPLLERMEHKLFVARGQSTSLLGPQAEAPASTLVDFDDERREQEQLEQDEYEGFGAHAEE